VAELDRLGLLSRSTLAEQCQSQGASRRSFAWAPWVLTYQDAATLWARQREEADLQLPARASRQLLGRGEPKEGLTEVTQKGTQSPMAFTMSQLLKRLKRATKQPGKKKELARFMSVQPPRVWEWIAGKKEPGGKATLRLLKWVTAEEAKQKPPVTALPAAGAKTQQKGPKSNETKPSGPKKR
jgi:hypothetical protein